MRWGDRGWDAVERWSRWTDASKTTTLPEFPVAKAEVGVSAVQGQRHEGPTGAGPVSGGADHRIDSDATEDDQMGRCPVDLVDLMDRL